MSHNMLIDYYKAIEDSSAKMLDAAKTEDWEQVMRFEGACAVLIEQLEQRAEKTRIMQRILNNDAQIRYLAEPWLMHCEAASEGPRQFLH